MIMLLNNERSTEGVIPEQLLVEFRLHFEVERNPEDNVLYCQRKTGQRLLILLPRSSPHPTEGAGVGGLAVPAVRPPGAVLLPAPSLLQGVGQRGLRAGGAESASSKQAS